MNSNESSQHLHVSDILVDIPSQDQLHPPQNPFTPTAHIFNGNMDDYKLSLFLFLQTLLMLLAVSVVYLIWKFIEENIINRVAVKSIPLLPQAMVPYIPFVKQLQQPKKKIVSPFSAAMLEDFDNLADKLTPSEEHMGEGREAAEKVFKKLRGNAGKHGIKIDRTRIAGSFGKGTGIIYMHQGQLKRPDMDLVVVVNNERPPFKNVYESFKEILDGIEEVHDIIVRKYSIEFKISTPTQRKIEFDLLAAPNFAKRDKKSPSLSSPWLTQDVAYLGADFAKSELDEDQQRALEENQTIDLEKNKLFSSSFSEKTVATINSFVSDPFVMKVVRLSKYWNSRLKIPSDFAPARSCMIELIAIHSQRKSRRRCRKGQRCVVCGFRRVMEAISKLSTLKIALGDTNSNGNNNGIDFNFNQCTAPMICDPVNLWNNLAHGMDPAVIDILETQAKKTLEILERFRNLRSAEYKSVENAIDEIFCPKE